MMQELKLLESQSKINWNEFFVSKSWAFNATIEKFGNNGDITFTEIFALECGFRKRYNTK
jgi:hypothetical protein